jgi:hypothetical protein
LAEIRKSECWTKKERKDNQREKTKDKDKKKKK